VLVRFRNGTTNLKVHQLRHLKPSPEMKTAKPKNFLTQQVKDIAPAMEKKRKLSKKKSLDSKFESSQTISAASN